MNIRLSKYKLPLVILIAVAFFTTFALIVVANSTVNFACACVTEEVIVENDMQKSTVYIETFYRLNGRYPSFSELPALDSDFETQYREGRVTEVGIYYSVSANYQSYSLKGYAQGDREVLFLKIPGIYEISQEDVEYAVH